MDAIEQLAMGQIKVTAQGVHFGKNCWMSHEKITGFTAERLNEGGGGIVGRGYMQWVAAALSANNQERAEAVCTVPPDGWSCSREAGHDGPCAASPMTENAVWSAYVAGMIVLYLEGLEAAEAGPDDREKAIAGIIERRIKSLAATSTKPADQPKRLVPLTQEQIKIAVALLDEHGEEKELGMRVVLDAFSSYNLPWPDDDATSTPASGAAVKEEPVEVARDALEAACRARHPGWDNPRYYGEIAKCLRREEMAKEIAAAPQPATAEPGQTNEQGRAADGAVSETVSQYPVSLGATVRDAIVGALQVFGYRTEGDDITLARRLHFLTIENRDLIGMMKAVEKKRSATRPPSASPVAVPEVVLIEWDLAHRIAYQSAAAFRPSYFNGLGFIAHTWVVEAVRSAHQDGQRHAKGLPPIDRRFVDEDLRKRDRTPQALPDAGLDSQKGGACQCPKCKGRGFTGLPGKLCDKCGGYGFIQGAQQ